MIQKIGDGLSVFYLNNKKVRLSASNILAPSDDNSSAQNNVTDLMSLTPRNL